MANTEIKSIALSVLNIATVTIVFASKAFIYILIALYVAGEMAIAEYAQSAPSTQPIALDTDLAEDIAEAIAPAVCTLAKSIARPGAVKSIALDDEILDGEKESIARQVDIRRYRVMTSPELRKECTAIGIRWRCAHGSKHLTKAEMFEALAA